MFLGALEGGFFAPVKTAMYLRLFGIPPATRSHGNGSRFLCVLALGVLTVCGLFSCAAARAGVGPQTDDLRLEAMRQELDRSFHGLRMENYEEPYFISFQHWDIEEVSIVATLGAVFEDSSNRSARYDVDVRVGDFNLDNSEDQDADFEVLERYRPSLRAPLDEIPAALRHALWLASDFRYKQALMSYNRVRGRRVFDSDQTVEVPSFSRERPVFDLMPEVALDFDRARWREKGRKLSLIFKEEPYLFDSRVTIKARLVTRRFVNTEGSVLRTSARYYSVTAEAVTRADDGMLLDHTYSRFWRGGHQEPTLAELEAGARRMIADLVALRDAPVLDPYSGPALLEPAAAGVFFHEALGHRLEAQRQRSEDEGQTFKERVGERIIPGFLSVVDDPTLGKLNGVPLYGHYTYDEEGVPARRVELVDGGILRSFLLSRQPIEGFHNSTGHGRGAPGRRPLARMGTLKVMAEGGLSDEELKERLMEAARRQGKPFGLRVGEILGGSTNTSAFGYQAFKGVPRMVYRVDAVTGEETLVRGVELVGTPLSSLNRVTFVGKEPGVFNGYCGAESGWVPVSAVAPATLFDEFELQRSPKPKERKQLLRAPWAFEQSRSDRP